MTPDQYTIQELFIDAGNGHQLYVHQWGNPKATPIFNLHGGPGDGSKDSHKKYFDPTQHHVIFFDQRGCGRSIPYGSLEHSTTQDLVSDIQKIADKLQLNNFVVTGASWGACLALAYAIEHPERVKALLLRGIFTGSHDEIEWLGQGRFKTFYPDVWEKYLQTVPKTHRKNPTSWHYKQALEGSEEAMRTSCHAYGSLAGAILSLDDRFTPYELGDDYNPYPARTEIHYMANNCFMPDKHILSSAHKLTMPVWIVQGRYDMICPPDTAYQLHKATPNSKLIWTIAGHSGGDRETNSVIRALLLHVN